MITVFGEGRGFRVVWLLEEMGIPYRLRPVDLLAGVEKDAEFLAINPAGFIPAIQDGSVTMVESIAIFESRLGLVTRQLARSTYLAGETFTAADISVTYALELAQRGGGVTLGQAERAYVARTGGREAYKRAMDICQATKAWRKRPASAV